MEALVKTTFHLGGYSITAGVLVGIGLFILLATVLTRMFGRRLSSRLLHRGASADNALLARRSLYFIVLFLVSATTLYALGIPVTAFAFVSGAVAIGVGFGAQNLIKNYISGWILMWERPIRIGDMLEVGDMRGTVEAINIRSTRVRRIDGVDVLIPNSQLLENMVVNWTLIDRLVRTVVRIGVAYRAPAERVQELMLQAVQEDEAVDTEHEPQVIFEDFGDNALVFEAYFWVQAGGERDLRVVRSRIRFRIADLFAANGIQFAYPQRDVHLDGEVRISRGSTKS